MKQILLAILLAGTLLTFAVAVQAATITATLSWTDNSNNEDGFRIERGSLIAGPFVQVGVTLANVVTFIDAALLPGTQYCYRVIAFNVVGNSAPSNVACITTQSTPAAPGNVTVTVVVTP